VIYLLLIGTKTWENTIGSALSTKGHYFRSGAEALGAAGYWGLLSERDPSTFTSDAGAPVKSKGNKNKKGGAVLTSPLSSGAIKSKKRRAELLGQSDDSSKNPKVRKQRVIPVPAFIPKAYFGKNILTYEF
jgi:hypothetical protein